MISESSPTNTSWAPTRQIMRNGLTYITDLKALSWAPENVWPLPWSLAYSGGGWRRGTGMSAPGMVVEWDWMPAESDGEGGRGGGALSVSLSCPTSSTGCPYSLQLLSHPENWTPGVLCKPLSWHPMKQQ